MPRSRARRRERNNLPLIVILVILTVAVIYAGFHSLFQAPEQKQEDLPPAQTSDGSAPEGDPEADAAAEALRSHRERKPDFYTILVSGVDDGNGGSDTNILLAVDAATGYAYGVSIPRDSKAVFNGRNHKINAAYNTGGMELLAEVVSEQLGIPVDYTVLVDLRGFEALVNAIGGVEFYIQSWIHMSPGIMKS